MVIAALIARFWIYPSRLVSNEDMQFTTFMLLLPIEFIMLTVHTLATGREPKLGNTKFTLSKRTLMLALTASFAFLGFIIGREIGFISGIVAAGGIMRQFNTFASKLNNRKFTATKI